MVVSLLVLCALDKVLRHEASNCHVERKVRLNTLLREPTRGSCSVSRTGRHTGHRQCSRGHQTRHGGDWSCLLSCLFSCVLY